MSTVGLPPVPASITDPEVRRWMEAVLETVAIRDGQRGDPLDRAVTVRELLGTGIAQLSQNSRSATSSVQIEATDQSPFTDLTPPENPRFFEVHANPRSVVLTWSKNQIFNVAHAEIHRSETDQFDDSVLIGVSPGQSYADTDVVSEQTYYYWVRYISYSNIPGAFFDLDPVSATVPLIGDNQLADINVDKLIGNKAAFVEANINEGSITNAMIGNEIRSDNYVAGSAGWRINKAGNAEFSDIKARGLIEGSIIRGSVIEGGLFIQSDIQITIPTEADQGADTVRYLALVEDREQVASTAYSGNGTSGTADSGQLIIYPANYTGHGIEAYGDGDKVENVYVQLNRYPVYNVNPVLDVHVYAPNTSGSRTGLGRNNNVGSFSVGLIMTVWVYAGTQLVHSRTHNIDIIPTDQIYWKQGSSDGVTYNALNQNSAIKEGFFKIQIPTFHYSGNSNTGLSCKVSTLGYDPYSGSYSSGDATIRSLSITDNIIKYV